jgi:hypothetical protein
LLFGFVARNRAPPPHPSRARLVLRCLKDRATAAKPRDRLPSVGHVYVKRDQEIEEDEYRRILGLGSSKSRGNDSRSNPIPTD